MEIICRDILKHWTNCWQGAMIAGGLFIVIGRQIDRAFNRQKSAVILLFMDGVFLYYLLYVTLISRVTGSRREVVLWPFVSFQVLRGEFHYIIENVFLFIPFGVLLCMTLCAYGRKCSMKKILLASFLTSVSVELLQYLFSCGKSETDDVIANVLGAVIGYLTIKLKRR